VLAGIALEPVPRVVLTHALQVEKLVAVTTRTYAGLSVRGIGHDNGLPKQSAFRVRETESGANRRAVTIVGRRACPDLERTVTNMWPTALGRPAHGPSPIVMLPPMHVRLPFEPELRPGRHAVRDSQTHSSPARDRAGVSDERTESRPMAHADERTGGEPAQHEGIYRLVQLLPIAICDRATAFISFARV